MDGFTGYTTAAAEELPTTTAARDPVHVVRLAGDALDRCRRRIQQELHGHHGLAADPLYRARRTLHTDADLLTDRQQARLTALSADDDHAKVETTWHIHQQLKATHRAPDTTTGRTRLETLIGKLSAGVPTALAEVATPDRTLKTCATDIPAFFDQPGNSNGPTEALNDRLEHLRGTTPGYRNLTHYIARSLLETSGVQTPPTPCNVKSRSSPA